MRIRWFETKRSASDRYLTIHDFETGTVSDHVEGNREKEHLYETFFDRFAKTPRKTKEAIP